MSLRFELSAVDPAKLVAAVDTTFETAISSKNIVDETVRLRQKLRDYPALNAVQERLEEQLRSLDLEWYEEQSSALTAAIALNSLVGYMEAQELERGLLPETE